MATLQEIIAKRREMQLTDPKANNVTARRALSSAVAPAPIAPVAPLAPAPTVQ